MMAAAKTRLKAYLLDRWLVPFSPVPGLHPSLYKRFRGSPNLSLIDIGAHKGEFTKSLQRACSVTACVLIEPLPDLASGLRADPLLSRYTVVECLVSDHAGEAELNYFPEAPDMSSVLEINSCSGDAKHLTKTGPQKLVKPVRILDEVAADFFSMRGIDLIKIDVQGAERNVLRGGVATLKRTAAVLVEVSFERLYEGTTRFDEVYDFMREQGFKLMSLEPVCRSHENGLLQCDALFVR